MSTKDLKNNVTTVNGFNPTLFTSDGEINGEVLDTKGYESLTYVLSRGLVTDGTFTVVIEHGEEPNLSDGGAVAADELIGLLSTMNSSNANERTTSRIGYVGNKRYVRLNIESAAIGAGNAAISCAGVLGHPHDAATAI